MFIHQSQLRPLLRAEQYYSEAQHRTELQHLFLPGWHPVAVWSQLRRPGSFRTLELLGTPLLLRNHDGEIRAFLNVCPHRHSRLTSKTSGQSERLRCQYHGWEFDGDGRTGRIPDAKAFRPWDRENSCLKRFRVGMAGELIFVSLAESGPSFEEFFDPAVPLWGGGFAEPFRFAAMWSQEFPCNWKVILENSLESYHVPEIHAATFGAMPTEESCEHDLQRDYTSFSNVLRKEIGTRMLNGLTKGLGAEVTGKYHHLNLHPHVTLTRVDLYRQIMFLEPSGPESCRFHNLIFTLRGKPFRPLQWVLAQMTRAAVLTWRRRCFAKTDPFIRMCREAHCPVRFPASSEPGKNGSTVFNSSYWNGAA